MGRKYSKCRNIRNSNKRPRRYIAVWALKRVASVNIDEYKFEVTVEVIEELTAKRQLSGNEDCGIIFGSVIDDKHYRINSVSESCRVKGKSTTYGCERDALKANEIIRREYQVSEHTRVYFGEWHTHPENDPNPSYRDTSSINRLVLSTDVDKSIDGLILVIVGREDIYWEFHDGVQLHKINPTII